jgi:hypothetical protein
LRTFAQELQTQLSGIAAPMNKLATQSGAQPQFGGFTEALTLAQSQQSAVHEVYDLLGQVKQAIGFAENVTTTIATAYQKGDEDAAASYTAAGAAASPPSTRTTSGQGTTTTSRSGTTTTPGSGTPASQGG